MSPFSSHNFSLIRSSNTDLLFWLYGAESDFSSKYNHVPLFLTITLPLLLTLPQWGVCEWHWRGSSVTPRSPQIRTGLTLTLTLTHTDFPLSSFLKAQRCRKPSTVPKNSNSEAESQRSPRDCFSSPWILPVTQEVQHKRKPEMSSVFAEVPWNLY